ncbi:MAG: helix-turn-helix domain-containing protein [Oscillospiraceae bacterium]|nr:helix-turn-helix domain-containing protein [Oscillospiraceae bacterium]
MELGQRIRQARQEAGLSQRQLCGEEITRNMLSLIENGTARPSMDTLRYIARQLGKPVGWFLEEAASPNQGCITEARSAFAEKEYTRSLEILDSFRLPDDVLETEYSLLSALSAMGAAEQALETGKKIYAAQLLEKAWAMGSGTPYFGEALQRRWCLAMYKTGQEDPGQLAARLPETETELLLRAEAAEDLQEKAKLLDAVTAPSPRCRLLRGLVALELKDYETAAGHLLAAESAYPKEAIPALERCYREQEDYKQAYLYACKLRQL